MRATTDVQASSGFYCCYAAVAMAVASAAEARDAVTDVTVSGSSYSFCAAAATATDSDASNHPIAFRQKRQGFLPFLLWFLPVWHAFFPFFPRLILSVVFRQLPGSPFFLQTCFIQLVHAVPIYDQSSHGLPPHKIYFPYIICIFYFHCHSFIKKDF